MDDPLAKLEALDAAASPGVSKRLAREAKQHLCHTHGYCPNEGECGDVAACWLASLAKGHLLRLARALVAEGHRGEAIGPYCPANDPPYEMEDCPGCQALAAVAAELDAMENVN